VRLISTRTWRVAMVGHQMPPIVFVLDIDAVADAARAGRFDCLSDVKAHILGPDTTQGRRDGRGPIRRHGATSRRADRADAKKLNMRMCSA